MSHQITEIDLKLGTVQRDAAAQVSWHGLETPVEGLLTDNCGLRSMNVQAATTAIVFEGALCDTPLCTPTVRHPINIGKPLFLGKPYDPKSYRLFTPAETLDFVKQCCDAAGLDNSLSFTTTLSEGSRMTIAKAMPDADFKDARGHEVKSFFNVLNSFDGSWTLKVNVSEIRTVCFNTATANIQAGMVSTKHTSEALDVFIQNFPQVFAAALLEHKGSENDYLMMGSTPLSGSQAEAFFVSLVSKGSKLSSRAYNLGKDKLFPLFYKGKGCYGQTAADAYNAVTEHFTHNSDAESNAEGGTADNYKREAREILTDGEETAKHIENGRKLIADYLTRK